MPVNHKFEIAGIKWIDVSDPSKEEMETLSRQYLLNEHTVMDCLQPEHLPKYEYDDEVQVHFLILRYYDRNSAGTISSIQDLTNKIAIFYTDNILITIHKNVTPFLEIIAKRLVKKCSSVMEILSQVMWQVLETFDTPVNKLSDQVDLYESEVMLKKTNTDVTESLFTLKRQASISHKVLMLMLEPINHMRVNPGEEVLVQDVRDQHLKIQTMLAQVLEDVNNLLTLSTSFAAQKTNEVVRVLTLFSVFFMPLTFIVGIYGMNFDFMPELRQRWGYPAVLTLMGLVSLGIYAWFRKKKWL